MENPSLTNMHKGGLVGGFNPSEKYWSMGRIILYIMENKHVPNHQPEVA